MSPTAPLITQRLGRFVVLSQLGVGGMGTVYAAYDEKLDRRVALKVLHRDEGATSAAQRTLREAQAMARVSHPNIVQIYEVGEVHGQVFIAMEFVPGIPLSAWQTPPRSWREILVLYRQAAHALQAAHSVGLIHRDFKPDNVLVDPAGIVRVVDFGVARMIQSDPPAQVDQEQPPPRSVLSDEAPPPSVRPNVALTSEGVVVGTLGYMAPEQLFGRAVDHRCDQFAFCAALHEALFGTLPYPGDNVATLRESMQRAQRSPRGRSADIPEEIVQAIERGLSLEVEQRFADMSELLAAIDWGDEADTPEVRRARQLFMFAGLPMLFGFLAMVWLVPNRVQLHHIVASAAVENVLLLLVTGIYYRSLQQSSFHRGVMVIAHGLFATSLLVRCGALRSGLSLQQLMPIDISVSAGFVALLSYFYLRRAAWIPPLMVLGAGALSVWPLLGLRFVNAIYGVAYLSIAYYWSTITPRLNTSASSRAGGAGAGRTQPSMPRSGLAS